MLITIKCIIQRELGFDNPTVQWWCLGAATFKQKSNKTSSLKYVKLTFQIK